VGEKKRTSITKKRVSLSETLREESPPWVAGVLNRGGGGSGQKVGKGGAERYVSQAAGWFGRNISHVDVVNGPTGRKGGEWGEKGKVRTI